MFSALSKTWFARSVDRNPEEIVSISIMPCTAKKAESALPTMKTKDGIREVDIVLTTREVLRLLQSNQVDITSIEEESFDDLMNHYSGAGVIFGAAGGVMEAALRSAHFLVTGENAPADAFADGRAREFEDRSWRESVFDLVGTPVRAAAASGLGNARALCEALLPAKPAMTLWRSWPARADAQAKADSPSAWMMQKWLPQELLICTIWTEKANCAAAMKTRISQDSTANT